MSGNNDDRSKTTRCEWELIDPDYGTWETACEQAFVIHEGSPMQNDMRFCCYCGKPLAETRP